jgi:hypothetical protein
VGEGRFSSHEHRGVRVRERGDSHPMNAEEYIYKDIDRPRGMPLTAYWRGELLTYWQLSGELEQLIADKDEMSRTEFAWHYPRTLATVRQIAAELRRYFGRNRQGGRRINIDPDTRDLIDCFMDA